MPEKTVQLVPPTRIAQDLNCCPETVQRMRRAGKIPGAVLVAGRWQFDYPKFVQWIDDGCPNPTESNAGASQS